jgi:predicted DNA-binding protein
MADRDNYKAPVSTRCTEELRGKLEQLASADSRPLAQYVRLVLEKHVEEVSAKPKKKAA